MHFMYNISQTIHIYAVPVYIVYRNMRYPMHTLNLYRYTILISVLRHTKHVYVTKLCPTIRSTEDATSTQNSLVSRIHGLEILVLDDLGQEESSDGEEHEDDDGEDHLDVGPGGEAEDAENGELDDLTAREDVHLPLGDPLDVVIGGVGGLLRHKEGHSLEHLVAIEGRHRHVEEEAVEDCFGDEGEDVGEQEHTDADGDVGEDVGESCLADVSDDVSGVAAFDAGLDVGEAADVEGGVGQDGVHEGQPEDGEDRVDDGHDDQVPVVGVTFLQLVLRAVDHGRADVLVHEEQDGEGEAEDGREEGSAHAEFAEVDRFELEGIVAIVGLV